MKVIDLLLGHPTAGVPDRYVRSSREATYFLVLLFIQVLVLPPAGATDVSWGTVLIPMWIESGVRFLSLCVMTVRIGESLQDPLGDLEYGGRSTLTLFFWWTVWLLSLAFKALLVLKLSGGSISWFSCFIPLALALIMFPVYGSGHYGIDYIHRHQRWSFAFLFSAATVSFMLLLALRLENVLPSPRILSWTYVFLPAQGAVALLAVSLFTLLWTWRANERLTLDDKRLALALSILVVAPLLVFIFLLPAQLRGQDTDLSPSVTWLAVGIAVLLVTVPFGKSSEEIAYKRLVLNELKDSGSVSDSGFSESTEPSSMMVPRL